MAFEPIYQDRMSVEDYLSRYQQELRKIARLKDNYKELETMITGSTANLSGMPSSGGHGGSKVEDGVIALIEAEEKIKKKIKRAEAIQEDIEKLISDIPEITYRQMLRGIYIWGKTVRQMAAEMEISLSKAYDLKSKAIKEAVRYY